MMKLFVTAPVPISDAHKQDLYKTELCYSWITKAGQCRYGDRCQYAHGVHDIRTAPRHPKYKTEPCFSYHFNGACPYGARCNFYHDSSEYEKICMVDSRFKELLMESDLRRKQAISNFNLNPNAPIFQPTTTLPHHDEPESLYSESSYTDAFELAHESFLSDSGCEHNDSSDFTNEPFTLGFIGGKKFLEQQHFSNHSDPNMPFGDHDNSSLERRRLPVFSKITAPAYY